MSRLAPYAGGAWSRGPRRAAGGSAAADPIKVRRRVISIGKGLRRTTPSELVRLRLEALAHGFRQPQPLALERGLGGLLVLHVALEKKSYGVQLTWIL